MRAYSETYVYDAMEILGEAVDFAVNDCGHTISEFFDMFLVSGIADQFGNGVPRYVAGMSGEELFLDIAYSLGMNMSFREVSKHYERSAEYWTGWILAYYQWYLGRSFSSILDYLPVERVLKLYPTLHEASEDKCIDTFNEIIRKSNSKSITTESETTSRLQYQRKLRGLSQHELAYKADVNLRTLQQYEIKSKSINKASADTVYKLAKVLGCQIEDILELELVTAE